MLDAGAVITSTGITDFFPRHGRTLRTLTLTWRTRSVTTTQVGSWSRVNISLLCFESWCVTSKRVPEWSHVRIPVSPFWDLVHSWFFDWDVTVAVDVVEIGERQAKIGEVLKVKPIAVLAMIDEGELDWKVVAISIDDPKADLVNNVADCEKHFPVSLLILSHTAFKCLPPYGNGR